MAVRFDVITLFPELFAPFQSIGVTRRAFETQAVDVRLWPLRDHADGTYRRVDDRPFGGGPGMVMTPQPIYDCLKQVKKLNRGPIAYMSPRGKILTQNYAGQLAKKILNPKNELAQKSTSKLPSLKSAKPGIILLCGRYEGIDQRIIDL